MAKYKFSNKLMFALVMQDEEICAEFIQRLFPGKKVKSITFPNDIKITPEKTIVTGVLSRSKRSLSFQSVPAITIRAWTRIF